MVPERVAPQIATNDRASGLRRPGLVVGLTGGIGSGKSAVAAVFRELGVPVLDADQVARDVVAPGQPALTSITDAFGPGVISVDGSLDRAALRKRVFADARARERLEAITHPAIRERMFAWLAHCHAQGAAYAVLEVPLLIETGLARLVDRVLVVDVPADTQVARVLARDGGSEAAARAVLAAQVDRATRLARADDVVDNTGTLETTREQVIALHARYSSGRPDPEPGRDRPP